ncbi:uncharacterized protein PRCAT00005050001 [Priceomyces carsonii]|uniref:uncharacterized protein n=1 Tax=Priceomyces carsonii TaxID=28549 RepID=UPI002ED85967|nr:unnamed protein product [Priceomyces carsonii]
MKPRSSFFAFLLVLLLLQLILADSNSDWYDWVLRRIQLSTAQGVLITLAGVAYEAETAYDIYNTCWNQQAPEAYFRTIRYAITRWRIELLALSKATGWYERDEKSNIEISA